MAIWKALKVSASAYKTASDYRLYFIQETWRKFRDKREKNPFWQENRWEKKSNKSNSCAKSYKLKKPAVKKAPKHTIWILCNASGRLRCAVHRKLRDSRHLKPDGSGGFRCCLGQECRFRGADISCRWFLRTHLLLVPGLPGRLGLQA